MSHDRGCHCGRESWDYEECPERSCIKKSYVWVKANGEAKIINDCEYIYQGARL